jgi:hypothetical protein
LRTQRAPSFFDNAPDSPALARITFHSTVVYKVKYPWQCQHKVGKSRLLCQ